MILMADRDKFGRYKAGHKPNSGYFKRGHAPFTFKNPDNWHTIVCPCGKEVECPIKLTHPRKYCSKKCMYKYAVRNYSHSEETKRKIGAANKLFYAAHPEKISTWNGGVTKNPGYKTAMKKKSRLHTQGSHTELEWEDLKKKYNFICPGCGRKEPDIQLTQDHVLSLSRGGTDYISNLQPLCHSCNSRKNYRYIKYPVIGESDVR